MGLSGRVWISTSPGSWAMKPNSHDSNSFHSLLGTGAGIGRGITGAGVAREGTAVVFLFRVSSARLAAASTTSTGSWPATSSPNWRPVSRSRLSDALFRSVRGFNWRCGHSRMSRFAATARRVPEDSCVSEYEDSGRACSPSEAYSRRPEKGATLAVRRRAVLSSIHEPRQLFGFI